WYGCYLVDRSIQGPHLASEFRPNPGGLFDMHGNVLEWCHDWLAEVPLQQIPLDQRVRRVFRGGGWDNGDNRCRSAYRNADRPLARLADVGLRVARTVVPDAPP